MKIIFSAFGATISPNDHKISRKRRKNLHIRKKILRKTLEKSFDLRYNNV